MTDNEIKREKTFEEELPYFKERLKEVFDNYHNPNGNEDPLYICVLCDSKRIVRKAEEEINRQKAEIERLTDKCESVFLCHDELIGQATKLARSEVIKEFAEKAVNKLAANYSSECCRWIDNTINDLVKEMVGDEQ